MTETIIAEKVVSSEGLAYWLKDPFFILCLIVGLSIAFLIFKLVMFLEGNAIRHTNDLKEQRVEYLAHMDRITERFGKSLDRVHLRTDEAIKELHVVKTAQAEQGKTIQDIAKKLKI